MQNNARNRKYPVAMHSVYYIMNMSTDFFRLKMPNWIVRVHFSCILLHLLMTINGVL